MLTLKEIVDSSSAKAFSRGETIASSENMLSNRKFGRHKDESEAFAHVLSSSGLQESFSSTIIMDEFSDEILDSTCTCAASVRMQGMCKHCVALALDFKRNPDAYDGFTDCAVRKTDFDTKVAIDTYLKAIPKHSQQLDHKFKMQDGKPTQIKDKSVHIDVYIKHDFGNWELKLKVIHENSVYTVSDIYEFAQAIVKGSFVEYGKRLGFFHTRSAFDETSWRLAEFIASMVTSFESPTLSIHTKSRSNSNSLLLISETELCTILGLLESDGFYFENSSTDTDITHCSIQRGFPDITCYIKPDEGGYVLTGLENVLFAEGIGTVAVIKDDRIWLIEVDSEIPIKVLKNASECDGAVFIADDDISPFCRYLLPVINQVIKTDIPNSLDKYIPQLGKASFKFDKTGQGINGIIELIVSATYGTHEYTLLSPTKILPEENEKHASSDRHQFGTDKVWHDERLENDAVSVATSYFPIDMQIPLKDSDRVGDLLFSGLNEFEQVGDVFTTSAFDALIKDKTPSCQIGLSINGDLIDMEIHPSDVSSEELSAVLSAYRKKRHYHRLKNGSFISLDEKSIRDLDALLRHLGVSPNDISSGKLRLPAYMATYFNDPDVDIFTDASFDDFLIRLNGNNIKPCKVPKSLKATLRPYQKDGLTWLFNLVELRFGGILADEMGLGKSVQLISLLLTLKEKQMCDLPSLIICPASLVYNWEEEFSKFAPSIKTCVLDGSKQARRSLLKTENPDVFIASYDTVRLDFDLLCTSEFNVVALDEAQYIKNHATKTARAVKRLSSKHRFALTGTPIENRLSEIWSIFDFLMPGFLGSYSSFRVRFEADILGGDQKVTDELSSIIAPFVLRRLKQSVLTELPDKSETTVYVHMEPTQAKLYHALEQDLRHSLIKQKAMRKTKFGNRGINPEMRVQTLSELMRLRQTALDPSLAFECVSHKAAKENAIIELIKEAMDAGKKTLLFSQFTSYLDILSTRFEDEGIDFYVITGATNKKKRIELVESFNTDNTPLFLVSLKAGGVGLNFTGASIVIHADPWWNSAAMEQAVGRAHRIGQRHNVNVYKIIAKDTIEERMDTLQKAKSSLAESIVSETSLDTLSSFDIDTLSKLLGC